MINTFMTRVPFFTAKGSFDSIDDLLALQINRAVCKNCVSPGLNPYNYLPEFICATDLTITPALTSVKVYKSDFTVHYTLTSGELALVTPHDVVVNGVSQTVYMFNGNFNASPYFTCGEQYFYVIRRGDSYWYSDMWEAGNFNATIPRSIITINYGAEGCNVGNIFYRMQDGFVNRLYIKSELLLGENETQINRQENDHGEVTHLFTKIIKRYKAVIPECFDPVYDALTTLPMYAGQENCTCEIKVPNMASEYADIVDFSIDNPDYKTNECQPIVKFNVAVQPKTINNGCCDIENELCFTGFIPQLPEVSPPQTGSIKLRVPIDFEPTNECYIQIAYKLTSNSVYTTINVLRSVLSLSSSSYYTIPVAAGSYHVKIRVLASTTECYSNYSLEQTVTVT